jgi:hypothetical protein
LGPGLGSAVLRHRVPATQFVAFGYGYHLSCGVRPEKDSTHIQCLAAAAGNACRTGTPDLAADVLRASAITVGELETAA